MARHTIEGSIGEAEVTITTDGPESQELPEGEKERGSDNIASRLRRLFDAVKRDVDREPPEEACPDCGGDGIMYDGLNEFFDCPTCEGSGEKPSKASA